MENTFTVLAHFEDSDGMVFITDSWDNIAKFILEKLHYVDNGDSWDTVSEVHLTILKDNKVIYSDSEYFTVHSSFSEEQIKEKCFDDEYGKYDNMVNSFIKEGRSKYGNVIYETGELRSKIRNDIVEERLRRLGQKTNEYYLILESDKYSDKYKEEIKKLRENVVVEIEKLETTIASEEKVIKVKKEIENMWNDFYSMKFDIMLKREEEEEN